MKKVKTEDYYIATIDLLGMKKIISEDNEDRNLNKIRNIYTSWKKIIDNNFFPHLFIKFYSDNVVIGIKINVVSNAADLLLEYVSYMAEHMLRCGYKPRGGICKGKFYIDDVFVWGKGLVDAYNLESKMAKYPRIVVKDEVLKNVSDHLKNMLIQQDEDGLFYLNYLRSFGRDKHGWIDDITKELIWVDEEINNTGQDKSDGGHNKTDDSLKPTVKEKLMWLKRYMYQNLEYWQGQP